MVVAVLVVLEIILFALNYARGTFLIGWDNIMPELNLWLNLKRSLVGVWADYRGLGYLDGMSQVANLVHTFYISFLSLFLPQNDVRYIFIQLTHLAGGIGFYFLAKKLFKNKKAAFLGALFYMFNIGIIQMFFAPLEVFTVHFAALPILALCIMNALEKCNKKNLLILFAVGFLTSQQGFVPTVFVVFLILFFFLLLFDFIKTHDYKKIIIIGFTLFAANAFWLTPYLYAGPKTAPVIAGTRINEFSSDEIFYRNQADGNLKNVLTLKGFMLESIEYDQIHDINFNFMQVWLSHYNTLQYQIVFALFILCMIIGAILAVVKRQRKLYPFLATLLVAFFFLANNTPILAQANNLIRSTVPLFGEAFRFPFTKFIIMFSFCFAIFLTYTFSFLFKKGKKLALSLFIILILASSYLYYPAFTGNFTSPLLRLSLPSYYQNAFAYFDKQNPDDRIALLPTYTFWNWQYRTWGQRGSGFLWYGLPQPLLIRSFDPWSGYNEEFYNEIAYAINTQDKTLFQKVLKKYDIHYLLIDTTIINTLSTQPINYTQLERFLGSVPFIHKEKTFGKLLVYKTVVPSSPVFSLDAQSLITSSPSFTYGNTDKALTAVDNYVTTDNKADIVPLMPSFFTDKLQEDNEFKAQHTNSSITVSPKYLYPGNISGDALVAPSLFQNEFLIPVMITSSKNSITLTPDYPKISINGKQVNIPQQPIVVDLSSIQNPTTILFGDTNDTIDLTKPNQKAYLLNNFTNTLTISNGTDSEIDLVDTKNIQQTPQIIHLSEAKINSLSITTDVFPSTQNIDNIIRSQAYQIQNSSQETSIIPGGFTHVTQSKDAVTIEAKSDSRELTFYEPNMYHQASYMMFITSHYFSGLPVNFYIDNTYERRSELESRLSQKQTQNVIVLPKTENFFQGYGFHFTVKSLGTEIAKSSLNSLSIYPFPAQTISNIKLINPNSPVFSQTTPQKTPVHYVKNTLSEYTATIPGGTKTYVVLSESFDSGWRAYTIGDASGIKRFFSTIFPFFFGKKLPEHVKINNWENGWLVEAQPQQTQIIIVFLPQYLEYLGFLFMPAALLFIIFKLKKVPQPEDDTDSNHWIPPHS
jgi:hypothetical protein